MLFLVPVCPGYEDFLPALVVVGPGLTTPKDHLPFSLPKGYGAVVIRNQSPGEKRNTFLNHSPTKTITGAHPLIRSYQLPGTWQVYYRNPSGQSGDYVTVFGCAERFSFRDILH